MIEIVRNKSKDMSRPIHLGIPLHPLVDDVSDDNTEMKS